VTAAEKGLRRLPTGIAGLDEAIGGIPQGRAMLVTGDAGAGKTVLALQFARASAAAGIKSVYLSTEEDADDLRGQAASFGWDLGPLEEKGTLRFLEYSESRAQETAASVGMGMEDRKARMTELVEHLPKDTKVLVLDSLSTHTANLDPQEFRDQFDLMLIKLRTRDITVLIIFDSATSRRFNEAALYHAYGAIWLQRRENPFTGQRERVMDIVKIRGTRTPIQLLPYEITPAGLGLTVVAAGAPAAARTGPA
jgi:KaiC/GvpD/RAD55 family RecA-like ATPase